MTGISLSTTARDLVRSGLFGKDWETNRDEIGSFLQLRFGPEIASNISASEQGVKEIEMFAFGLATANWFGDRQADETSLMHARLRAYTVSIARQLGYKPSAAVPPAVSITMTLAAPGRPQLRGLGVEGVHGPTEYSTSSPCFIPSAMFVNGPS